MHIAGQAIMGRRVDTADVVHSDIRAASRSVEEHIIEQLRLNIGSDREALILLPFERNELALTPEQLVVAPGCGEAEEGASAGDANGRREGGSLAAPEDLADGQRVAITGVEALEASYDAPQRRLTKVNWRSSNR